MSTYNRRLQLGASRRRKEDAHALAGADRATGALYLGGYAVECSFKALICYLERKDDFQETSAFQSGFTGARLHILSQYVDHLRSLKLAVETNQAFKDAWKIVTSYWITNDLRYSDRSGDNVETQRFLKAVELIHRWALSQQAETP